MRSGEFSAGRRAAGIRLGGLVAATIGESPSPASWRRVHWQARTAVRAVFRAQRTQ